MKENMPISLIGEQKRILALPMENPIQIKGVAGSGKTTVAIFRAKHLVASAEDFFRDTHVCIFSYTKNLAKYVRSILGSETKASTRITVTNYHKWAREFLTERDFWSNRSIASHQSIHSTLAAGLAELRSQYQNRAILSKPIEFYKAEFKWIKGRSIYKKQAYLEANRIGRGNSDRVTAQDKELLWDLYYHYCHDLRAKNKVDWDDISLKVLAYIKKEPTFQPPFSHVVVDEAQDLTSSQLLSITKLVNSETNSITIIADAAQRIYKSGFAWSDVGINIRGGRTIELKHNYRNTRQIAEAAISLLEHDSQQGDFSEHILPVRHGPKPKVLHLPDGHQAPLLRNALQSVDLSQHSAVVLHRQKDGVDKLTEKLLADGFSPTNISLKEVHQIQPVGLFTCTMSSVKGLEFDHVFLCDVNDDLIPHPAGFADENDELHVSTERRLVYMCMTRARETLNMISTGQPSRYLSEIDPTSVERV
jgi:superfamily I DNA/RNA helicase